MRVNKDEYWQNKMVSIFNSNLGEVYLLDCDQQSSTFKQIFFYSLSIHDFNVIISVFDSLQSCLTTIIQGYEKKILAYDEENKLIDDFYSFNKLGKKLNPKSEMWNLPGYIEET